MDPRGRTASIIVSFVVVFSLLFLLLHFVISPFDMTGKGKRFQEDLRIGFLQSLDSLNPYVGLSDASHFFYSLVYDCLTTVDEDLNPTGNLAINWWKVPVTDTAMVTSGDPYGSVWEYNLTHNAIWHDGVQFTADDVAYNLNLNAQHYDLMWAYQPYAYFIEAAEKVDNYTVRIHFWDRATGESMPVAWGDFIPIHILPKHLLEQLPGGYANIGMSWTGTFSNTTSPGMPVVGTGPWMGTPSIMSDWIAGDHVTLVRNPSYHWKMDKPGAPEIQVEKLVMQFFDDSTAMALSLENKMTDAAKYPLAQYDAIRDAVDYGSLKNVTCYSGPSCTQGYIYLSYWMETAGGDNDARLDPDVRKAMALAIDRAELVSSLFHGLADPGSTVVPPVNLPWHYEPNSSELISYNVTEANQLLESSGYIDIDSDGIRECTITSKAVQMDWVVEGTDLFFEVPLFNNPYCNVNDIGQFLKYHWLEIGVNASTHLMDDTIYPLFSPIYCPIQEDVSVSYWSILDQDPECILFTLSDAGLGGWSDTGFSNVSYNENFTLSVSTLDASARKVYTDNCQKILYEQCPQIVLAYPCSNYALRNDSFTGWGDWAAHPGRSLDGCWGANPLFFDLEPVWMWIFPDTQESEPSASSWVLEGVTAAAVAGTVAWVYSVWRRERTPEPPRKTE